METEVKPGDCGYITHPDLVGPEMREGRPACVLSLLADGRLNCQVTYFTPSKWWQVAPEFFVLNPEARKYFEGEPELSK